MAKQGIGTGLVPNDGLGDTLVVGAVKINSNFNEIYSVVGNGTTLGLSNLTTLNVSGVTTMTGDLNATGKILNPYSIALNIALGS